jgi:hypothetical protein
MTDKFNLTSFLKKNQLLNENIGGYVDIKPVKEEMVTTTEEDIYSGGYIEVLGPKFQDGLNMMDEAFREWLDGPNTSPEDIRPAILDLIEYVKDHFLEYRR